MDQEMVDLVVSLAHQGVRGDSRAFQLRLRRAVSRLRDSEPELATRLIGVLSEGPAPTREVHESPRKEHVQRSAIENFADHSSIWTDRLDKNKPAQALGFGNADLFGSSIPSNMPVDGDSRQSLVTIAHPDPDSTEMPAWTKDVDVSIRQLLREWILGHELRSNGLSPSRSMLLAGPPGVGKTMTASWVAAHLRMPLLTLDLSTVMSSFLGKTGNNIRSVIDFAKTFPCVLLLDEFDSIAKRRDDETDVGELKRLVTVLLQSVDNWPDTSLLIAATNHEELLDPAVWRRFDLILRFELPRMEAIERFLIDRAIDKNFARPAAKLLQGQTFARIDKIINVARKASILDGISFEECLSLAIIGQSKDFLADDSSLTLELISLHLKGMSQRAIATQLNMAHSTVGRHIRSIFGSESG